MNGKRFSAFLLAVCMVMSLLIGCEKTADEPAPEPAPGTTAPSEPAPQDISYEGYNLKWEDNFDGTELDRKDWNVELHDPGWVNEEWQSYVDSTENIYIEDGSLVLKVYYIRNQYDFTTVVDGVADTETYYF